MLDLRAKSLRSRVSRRIFSAFLLCALVPFAVLVVIAYSQLASFFNQKSQRQLRELAKSLGTDIHVRLVLLEAELRVIAAGVKASAALADALPPLPVDPQQRFKALAVFEKDRRRSFFGHIIEVPEPTPSERDHLASGKDARDNGFFGCDRIADASSQNAPRFHQRA
jgi:hypothetical protein